MDRCRPWVALHIALSLVSFPSVLAADAVTASTPAIDRFVGLALDCVHREYPNKIAHVLQSDADVRPPRELTPSFYGCFDWHSAVHGHWLLARAARQFPQAEFAGRARAALARSLTSERLQAEVAYLRGPGRATFERPYGLAWLLQLGMELREWDDPEAKAWSERLAPLEQEAMGRVRTWLPKLTRPVRTGEHSQTAFALGLMLDWARRVGEAEFAALIESRARQFYGADRSGPLNYEPSGEDFLSPCLAEADLMRRVLRPDAFAEWLETFLPGIPKDGDALWLVPAAVSDRSDGKLAHLDGLNLSRAWMLEGVASGLPGADRRREALRAVAAAHRTAGLDGVRAEHYEGGHWLGTFALYLVSERGLR